MELATVKQRVFLWMGWLSIITGLITLVFLNISLLWGLNVPIGSNIPLWLCITLAFGIISTTNKNSRSLGLWGLSLGIYLGFFLIVMFMLSWTINPFP